MEFNFGTIDKEGYFVGTSNASDRTTYGYFDSKKASEIKDIINEQIRKQYGSYYISMADNFYICNGFPYFALVDEIRKLPILSDNVRPSTGQKVVVILQTSRSGFQIDSLLDSEGISYKKVFGDYILNQEGIYQSKEACIILKNSIIDRKKVSVGIYGTTGFNLEEYKNLLESSDDKEEILKAVETAKKLITVPLANSNKELTSKLEKMVEDNHGKHEALKILDRMANLMCTWQ